MPLRLRRRLPVERPPGPLHGFKLAHPMLSADGRTAGFGGIWSSAQTVYGLRDTAVCFWNRDHSPPKRRCSCGFYCLHSFDAARAMACAAEYRSTLILEVEVAGRFVRYDEGFRYSRQRVLGATANRCGCGRSASVLVDSGSGITGWLRLQPCCPRCAHPKEALTLAAFGALLGDPGLVRTTTDGAREPDPEPDPEPGQSSSLSLLAAEVALLQARIDSLQEAVSKLGG